MKRSFILKLPNHLKQFLSLKVVSIATIIGTIINRLIQIVFFYNIRVDASYQLLATENFLHGHGLSISHISNLDLSTIQYETLINWPPGYSLLIAPLFVLTGHNYVLSGIMLDFLFAAILVVYLRKILLLYATPLYLINIFTLFSGFFIYSFYFIASSDSVTITFFCVGLYYLLAQVQGHLNGTRYTIVSGICFSACVLIKYLFIPIAATIPAIYLLRVFETRNNSLKKYAIVTGSLVLCTIAGVILFQKLNAGSSLYISSTGRGFFPEHLLNIYPFILSGFLRPETVRELLPTAAFGQFYALMKTLNILLFLFMVYYCFRQIKTTHSNPSDRNLFLSFLLISVITLGLLSFLSITVSKEEILPGVFWTYVEEARYYGLVVVLLHVMAFLQVSLSLKEKSGAKKVLFVLIFIMMLIPEFARGVYFIFNRLKLFSKEEYSWQYEDRFQKFANTIIQRIRAINPQENIVVGGSSYYYNHRISLYSHVPILNKIEQSSSQKLFGSTTKTVLLLVVEQKDLAKYRQALECKTANFFGKFDNFYFYTIYVEPNK